MLFKLLKLQNSVYTKGTDSKGSHSQVNTIDQVDAVSRIPDPKYDYDKLKQKWAKYLPLGKLTGDPKKYLLTIFPEQFTGIRLLPREYDIYLDPDAVPVQMPARNLPRNTLRTTQEELD